MSLEDKIKEAIENDSLEETLEKIVDQKVEEKLEEQNTKKEEKQDSEKDEKTLSRRSFLKKIGFGAAGLGAASLIPTASALKIKDSDGFQASSGNTEYLDVNPNGPVEVKNTNLSLASNDLDFNSTQNDGGINFNYGSGWAATPLSFSAGGTEKFRVRHQDNNNQLAIYDATGSGNLIEFNESGTIDLKSDIYTGSTIRSNTGKPTELNLSNSEISNQSGSAGNPYLFKFYNRGSGNLGIEITGPLRIATGQSIEDGSGNERIKLKSSNTSLLNGDFHLNDNSVTTNNFEITENSSTNSLDFNYTG